MNIKEFVYYGKKVTYKNAISVLTLEKGSHFYMDVRSNATYIGLKKKGTFLKLSPKSLDKLHHFSKFVDNTQAVISFKSKTKLLAFYKEMPAILASYKRSLTKLLNTRTDKSNYALQIVDTPDRVYVTTNIYFGTKKGKDNKSCEMRLGFNKSYNTFSLMFILDISMKYDLQKILKLPIIKEIDELFHKKQKELIKKHGLVFSAESTFHGSVIHTQDIQGCVLRWVYCFQSPIKS
jgi:hypothetical protein